MLVTQARGERESERQSGIGRGRKGGREEGRESRLPSFPGQIVFPSPCLCSRSFYSHGGVLCRVRGASSMGGVRAVWPSGGLLRVHGEDAFRHGGFAVLHLQAGLLQCLRHQGLFFGILCEARILR